MFIINRRNLLKLTIATSINSAILSCSINPVSGRSQLTFYSKEDEISIDSQNAKHQFSSDYGQIQNNEINKYISDVGNSIAKVSQRPDMPYSFRVLNAVYVNAYTFPAGSVAITRGMLVNLSSEAELAATLGHEIGHVAARHTINRMTKGMIIGGLLTGLLIYLSLEEKSYVPLASTAAGIGGTLLLAKYSRNDERQADSLGMNYMVKAGYNPEGMVLLMDMLNKLQKEKPNMLEVMFATHPMSDERYKTAKKLIKEKYSTANNYKFYKERYMDTIAPVLQLKPAIEELQKASTLFAEKKYDNAEEHINKALQIAPDDYASLLYMAKCQFYKNQYSNAYPYAKKANEVYSNEAQANFILGIICIKLNKYEEGLVNFENYDKKLPDNPEILFYKGFCSDKLALVNDAINYYKKYLSKIKEGQNANYARRRLIALRGY
jgi:predicted Zn-dependent protease